MHTQRSTPAARVKASEDKDSILEATRRNPAGRAQGSFRPSSSCPVRCQGGRRRWDATLKLLREKYPYLAKLFFKSDGKLRLSQVNESEVSSRPPYKKYLSERRLQDQAKDTTRIPKGNEEQGNRTASVCKPFLFLSI